MYQKYTIKPEEIIEETPKSIRRYFCLQEMRKIFTRIGPWAVNKNQLAEKYFFERHTITRWYNNLLKRFDEEDIENIRLKINHSIDKAMALIEIIIIDPSKTTKEKIMAINSLNDTIKTFTEFLEEWGRKAKIPNKYEIEQKSIKINTEIKKYSMIFEKLTPEEQKIMREALIKEVENEGEPA